MDYSYSVIYKKIEDEVIKLSSAIYFCDEQLDVYSVDIADLIMRCSVELEAIIKQIFYRENGVFNDSPGNVLNWMEEKWHISKKKIKIVYPSFCFNTLREFFPFEYESQSREDYYSTYNAIKHNRAKNINKANLYSLIRLLGALFIAETYFENKRIDLSEDKFGETINRMGISSIFSFWVAPCEEEIILDSYKDIIPDMCIYKIMKTDGEYAFRIKYQRENGQKNVTSLVSENNQFQQFAKECVDKEVDMNYLVNLLSNGNKQSDISSEKYLEKSLNAKRIISIQAYKRHDRYYAELYKEKSKVLL